MKVRFGREFSLYKKKKKKKEEKDEKDINADRPIYNANQRRYKIVLTRIEGNKHALWTSY